MMKWFFLSIALVIAQPSAAVSFDRQVMPDGRIVYSNVPKKCVRNGILICYNFKEKQDKTEGELRNELAKWNEAVMKGEVEGKLKMLERSPGGFKVLERKIDPEELRKRTLK